jgi:gluconate 5-dehydrogenase
LFDLTGKVALVTGASSGLGRAIAAALAGAGARIVAVARRRDRLDALVAELGGEAAAVAADVADRASLQHWTAAACAPFGSPDILVNAAGINRREPADAVTPEGWDETLALNLGAPFFIAQRLVPAMIGRGWGRVINVASLQSYRAFANGIAYGASKGGIVQLTRAMAEAWSGRGVACNAIGPGFFPTELTQPVFADAMLAEHLARQTAIGRNGTLDDVRGLSIFLASPASDYVTGQTIMLDGGFTAK